MSYFISLPVILFLAMPGWLWAASFDCANAATKVEKLICSHADISMADDRLAQVYTDALKKALNRPRLVEGQREWLQNRKTVADAAALLKMYRDRIRQLDSVARADTPQFSADSCDGFLQRNDIGDIADCRVAETGVIGAIGGLTYHYALYCIVPEYATSWGKCGSAGYYLHRGLAIFTRAEGGQRKNLFLERGSDDVGMFVYAEPAMVKNSLGTFLHIPIRVDGTGNFNESEYYLWNERLSEWTLLDAKSWLRDLKKQLPPDLSIWKGVWPDIATMKAEAGLYHEGDGNCCPTGGTAEIVLSLKDNRLQLKSFRIRKDAE